ncbi:MAG: 2-amino-4-hydroxy-6-hydroxymethyldihydropteridine diphosphokinase [Alphaproteobacteria bacterium]|nr:2-amino-4-hydroxy-6-hydroxymethyldihydropteridine diphosphokinase [Alphaproteobacteria bacterium]
MPIYIGLGANLDHPRHGPPQRTLARALTRLAGMGVRTVRRSRWYRSSPVPPSDQPWYVNAVAEVRTGLAADATLAALHRVEHDFGRVRGERDAARWIDLDLLDYDSLQKSNAGEGLAVLPHPRLHLRAFVLLPLAELAPDWRHPVSGEPIAALIARLPPDQSVEPLSG